eukprot:CAMPEP_0178956048 /NCGR_PEP_ID=MMETSP0789-20121207/9985_1 /TAXON_ID=3005 /ORGANISM="Rhizosolenia setigera, Strain CCMP 1694" /LENGTH=113 /DNA_ID=CAMNT_0020637829 /DNA_START=173 /DNA_END=514 /DNA_ORIENTATION=+
MGDWMRGDINGTITEVPGIGPAAAKKLANGETPDECITNTYQLIGKFLSLKGPDEEDEKVDSLEHMEKFWQYLASRGISSHRSAIVKAIAEKMNSFLPGIYDPEQYESDEDED